MQEILQIKNNTIVVSANKANDYSDTLANFALDSGVKLPPIDMTMYNRTDKILIVDGKIVDFANSTVYDNIIDTLSAINNKKYQRLNPVKPKTKQDKLQELINDFNAQKDKITAAYTTAVLTGNQVAATQAQADYRALVTNCAKSRQTINKEG